VGAWYFSASSPTGPSGSAEQTYGGHDATVASETSEYGCISRYELDERDDASLVLTPTMPFGERSSAGEEKQVIPEAELLRLDYPDERAVYHGCWVSTRIHDFQPCIAHTVAGGRTPSSPRRRRHIPSYVRCITQEDPNDTHG